MRLVAACKNTENTQKIFKKWRYWARLRKVYHNYTGDKYQDFTKTSYLEAEIFGALSVNSMTSTRFLFREWRASSRLQSRRVSQIIKLKREIFFSWTARCSRWNNGERLAVMYDGIRKIRPILYHWLSSLATIQFSQEHASSHNRHRLLSRCIKKWQDIRSDSLHRNKFFGRWRSVTDFRCRNILQGADFCNTKILSSCLRKWRLRKNISRALEETAEKMRIRQKLQAFRLTLNVWREMCRWIFRNSEKVRVIRAAKDARACFQLWRTWGETRQAADSMYKASVLRHILGFWQSRLAVVHTNHVVRASTFEKWRRMLSTRNCIRQYYSQKHSLGASSTQKQPQTSLYKKDLPVKGCFERYHAFYIFQKWRQRALLVNLLDLISYF